MIKERTVGHSTKEYFEHLQQERLQLIEQREDDLRAYVDAHSKEWAQTPEGDRKALTAAYNALLAGLGATYEQLMLDILERMKESICDLTPQPEIERVTVVPTLLYADKADAKEYSRGYAKAIVERLEAHGFMAYAVFKETPLTDGDDSGQWIVCANCTPLQLEYVEITSSLRIYERISKYGTGKLVPEDMTVLNLWKESFVS